MSRAVSTNRKPKIPRERAYRFDARLNKAQKLLIQKAADMEGRSLTDFVLRSAEAAAERTLQDRATLVLSARDTEAFLEAVLRPAAPGQVLRTAARRYRRSVARQ